MLSQAVTAPSLTTEGSPHCLGGQRLARVPGQSCKTEGCGNGPGSCVRPLGCSLRKSRKELCSSPAHTSTPGQPRRGFREREAFRTEQTSLLREKRLRVSTDLDIAGPSHIVPLTHTAVMWALPPRALRLQQAEWPAPKICPGLPPGESQRLGRKGWPRPSVQSGDVYRVTAPRSSVLRARRRPRELRADPASNAPGPCPGIPDPGQPGLSLTQAASGIR